MIIKRFKGKLDFISNTKSLPDDTNQFFENRTARVSLIVVLIALTTGSEQTGCYQPIQLTTDCAAPYSGPSHYFICIKAFIRLTK